MLIADPPVVALINSLSLNKTLILVLVFDPQLRSGYRMGI